MPALEAMWDQWIGFAVAALSIATMMAIAVYLISNILQNDKMKGWAKMELTEIFYSAVIIAMALPALTLVDEVVQGAILLGANNAGAGPVHLSPTMAWIKVADSNGAGAGYERLDICGDDIADNEQSVYHNIPSCHMRLGIWYLREVFDETKNFAFEVYLSYIWTAIAADFTVNVEFIFEKAGFFNFNPFRGFFTMGNTIKIQIFDWAMKIMMISKFQEIMLHFISIALFPALFVSGAILRAFTFTRKLGGLLLAMALSLYFIFPAFYAFGAVVMLDIKNKAYDEWISPDNPANPGNMNINPLDGPENYPNPPISNTMYISRDVPMVGGSGTFSTVEAQQNLRDLEGTNPADFHNYVELNNPSASGAQYIPDYDFSSGPRGTAAEQDSTLARAYAVVRNWFDALSGENKFDTFALMAWSKNGPIEVLSRLTFWSLFFSLFSMISTIAAIRSLSMAFGGDIEIAGLTRLI